MNITPEPYMEIDADLGAEKVVLRRGGKITLYVKDLTIGGAKFNAEVPALLVVNIK